MNLRKPIAAFSAALTLASIAHVRAAETTNPIVVELFTSQGCSSCPPADAFLGDLAKNPDILALSFHVDYWDYIGWKDPFASHQATLRQRKYAEAFDIAYVYTPQMVVQGTSQAVGSDRSDIEAAIAHLREKRPAHPRLSIERHDDGGLSVEVGAGTQQGAATLWLVCYDRRHDTEVSRGENAGATLVDYHVVRRFEAIGDWNGEALSVTVPADKVGEFAKEPNGAVAVLLQSSGTGPIIAAAELPEQHK